MQQDKPLYIIGVGGPEDWDAGAGSLYYVEDKNGEKAMPVFTTSERIEKFIGDNFDSPEAHMQMLESLGVNVETHANPLTEGRFTVMPVNNETFIRAALKAGIDYLVRDPRPGTEQEIFRLKDR